MKLLLTTLALLLTRTAAGGPPPVAVTEVSFNGTFSDFAVLQAAGTNATKAAVYGLAPPAAALTITVASTSGADATYTIPATATAKGHWKAFLKPTPAVRLLFLYTFHTAVCSFSVSFSLHFLFWTGRQRDRDRSLRGVREQDGRRAEQRHVWRCLVLLRPVQHV